MLELEGLCLLDVLHSELLTVYDHLFGGIRHAQILIRASLSAEQDSRIAIGAISRQFFRPIVLL